MAYDSHFILADDMINHLNSIVGGTTDPFMSSRYVGFVSVSAVTVYELALKEILSILLKINITYSVHIQKAILIELMAELDTTILKTIMLKNLA